MSKRKVLPTLQTTISAGRTKGRYLLVTPHQGKIIPSQSRVVSIQTSWADAKKALAASRRRGLTILTFAMDGLIYRQCEL